MIAKLDIDKTTKYFDRHRKGLFTLNKLEEGALFNHFKKQEML